MVYEQIKRALFYACARLRGNRKVIHLSPQGGIKGDDKKEDSVIFYFFFFFNLILSTLSIKVANSVVKSFTSAKERFSYVSEVS